MAYNDFRMDNQWLPFTPNRAFQKDPRVFTGADGMYFTTHDGRQVIDGISSLWCVGAGHNRKADQRSDQEAAGHAGLFDRLQHQQRQGLPRRRDDRGHGAR